MIDVSLDCPGCGSAREFVQVHAGTGRCPDGNGGPCPEWFCSACGTALLLRLAPPPGGAVTAASAGTSAGQLDRVA